MAGATCQLVTCSHKKKTNPVDGVRFKSKLEPETVNQRNKHNPRTDTARYGLLLRVTPRNGRKMCAGSVYLAIPTAMRGPAWVKGLDARTFKMTAIDTVGGYGR